MTSELPPAYDSLSPPPPLINLAPEQQEIDANLKWDEKHKRDPVDADLAIILYDGVGRMLDISCFNQTRIAGNAVVHSGDKRDGSKKGTDEGAHMALHLLPPVVQFVLVVVTIASDHTLKSFKNFSLSLQPLDVSHDLLETKEQTGRSFVPFAFVRTPTNFKMLDVAHWSPLHGLANVWPMCDQVLEKLVDPVLWRERPQARYDLLNLKKGQDVVMDSSFGQDSMTVGVGWDVGNGSGFDVDAWVYQMSRSKHNHVKIHDKIYYAHLTSNDESTIHGGDNRTGKGKGDDEKITINFSAISNSVIALVVVVKIYDPKGLGTTFKDIDGEYVRLLDSKKKVIARYDLDSDSTFDDKTCGVFCVIRRIGHSWRLEPMAKAANSLGFEESLPDLIEKKFQ